MSSKYLLAFGDHNYSLSPVTIGIATESGYTSSSPIPPYDDMGGTNRGVVADPCAVSADGRTIVFGAFYDQSFVSYLDMITFDGDSTFAYIGHVFPPLDSGYSITKLAISGDGAYVAAGYRYEVRLLLFNGTTYDQIQLLSDCDYCSCLAMTDDGNYLAVAGEFPDNYSVIVRIYKNNGAGSFVGIYDFIPDSVHANDIYQMNFSGDGMYLFLDYDYTGNTEYLLKNDGFDSFSRITTPDLGTGYLANISRDAQYMAFNLDGSYDYPTVFFYHDVTTDSVTQMPDFTVFGTAFYPWEHRLGDSGELYFAVFSGNYLQIAARTGSGVTANYNTNVYSGNVNNTYTPQTRNFAMSRNLATSGGGSFTGIGSMTLAGVTMAGVLAGPEDSIADSAVLADSVLATLTTSRALTDGPRIAGALNTYLATTMESLIASVIAVSFAPFLPLGERLYPAAGLTSSVPYRPLADSVAVADLSSYIYLKLASLAETLALADGTVTQAAFNPLAVESMVFADLLGLYIEGVVAEIITLSPQADAARAVQALAAELLQAYTEIQNTAEMGAAALDALRLKDSAILSFFVALADSFMALADAATQATFLGALRDALLAAVSLEHEYLLLLSVQEQLAVHGQADANTVLMAQISESAVLGVVFMFGDDVYQGWCVNSQSLGASRYDNFAFNSMSRVQDRFFAASDAGLFVLEGEQDDGAPIACSMTTGKTDFGSANIKTVRQASIGYTADEPMVLRVIYSENGVESEVIYKVSKFYEGDEREARVKLGRGVKSRYWQFRIDNTNGGDLDLDRLDFDVLQLARRVR